MNGLVAAVKFLLETVAVQGGATTPLTFAAQPPAGGTSLGSFTVGQGFVTGYYIVRISDPAGITPTDDFVGYWHVTALP
jgi:hypothetical protein